jgi:peptidoglycan/LPS O-acetylase OafA/YrhL
MSNRLRGLDALRGLAALAVVLHHYTARYSAITEQPLPVSFSLPEGQYGVELFFILSGFVIFMTLERTPRLYDFVSSRVARLWPAYIACMTVTLIVATVAAPPWYPHQGPASIAKNLSMMPMLLGAFPIDGSYWSLTYEILFYGWAAAAFFLAGPRHTELLCTIWLAASFAWHHAEHPSLPWKLQRLTELQFANLFVIGIMIYRIRTRQNTVMAALVLACALVLSKMGPYWSLRPIRHSVFAVLVATFALLVWGATTERSWLGRIRPLVWLGEISYPLYLIHQVIGYVLLQRLTGFGLGANLAVLATIALVILPAYLISRYIERPGQKAVRSLFARFGNRGPAPASGPGPATADSGAKDKAWS